MTALERLAGGVLCVGFRGDTPATAPLDELRALAPGGIVLFSRNLSASPERNRELVNAIREALGGALFAIDQEGGRVVRLRRGALALPSAMAVAASGEPSAANLLALGVAGDLRAIGVDLNFAPVADLALAACGTVIGTRAYSDDPQRAAALVAATVRGLRRGDIGATLKHFPGHGATAVDSHAALPVLEVDGATFVAAFPEVNWFVGSDTLSHWRGELDYWIFSDGEVGLVQGSVSGEAEPLGRSGIVGTIAVTLDATDRDRFRSIAAPG